MDFLLSSWQLVLAVVLSGGFLLFSFLRKASNPALTPVQVVNKINREKAVVVDIREPETFDVGHLIGAKNIPMSKIKEGTFTGLPKNKTLPIILVCATGVTVNKAKPYLIKEGYENVFILGGGMGAWIKEDFPIEKTLTEEEKKAIAKEQKSNKGNKKSSKHEKKPEPVESEHEGTGTEVVEDDVIVENANAVSEAVSTTSDESTETIEKPDEKKEGAV